MVRVESVDFIAPTIPPGSSLAREEIRERADAILFNSGVERVRLPAVLAPRGEDQFTDVLLALAPTVTAAGEQHDFGLMPDGETEADGKVRFC